MSFYVDHFSGGTSDEAAIEAVKKWKYTPYLYLGQPVEVESKVYVNFNLQAR